MKVFRMLQGSFKGISRKIKWRFNEVFSWLQGCLNEVEWVFERVLQGISRMFQGSFRGVLRDL